jgi:hypothetical protein
MRRPWIILGGVASLYLVWINATNDPPAYAYLGLSKQTWVALGLHHLSHPCLGEMETKYGTVGTSLPTDQCFRMSEPKRMQGVWIDEFEGSQFLPGARDVSRAEVGLGGIWLDVETNRIPGLLQSPAGELRAFEIEFIGRQTAVAGQYGHMGGRDHEIIVDQLISARPVDVATYARKLDLWRQRFLGEAN